MQKIWLLWITLSLCLSVGLPTAIAQEVTYPVITAVNAPALEQIGIMGGDQGRIAVSLDNHWMAIGGLQGVWIIDLDAGDTAARLLTGHTDKVNAVKFHPIDNNILASAGDDGTIRLWNVETGENTQTIQVQATPIFGIDFDRTATLIASAGGATVRLFHLETGEQQRVYANVPEGFRRVAFVDDSPLLLAATFNSSLAAWNLNENEFLGEINKDFNSDVQAIATTADGQQVAIALFSGRVITSAIDSGDQLIFDYHQNGVLDVAYSPNGNMLASAGMDNKVLITDTQTGDLFREFELDDFTYSLAFSRDNRLLYVASNDGKVTTWDIERSQIVQERALAFPTVRQVVYSPSGRFIAAVTDEDSLGRVFNAETHKQIAVLNGHEGRTFAIAYRPDGRLIATAGSGGDVLIWSTDTFDHVDTLSTTESRIYSLAFSPDVNVLATGGEDHIRLWNLPRKQEIMALNNEDTVWGLSFSADGSLIAAPGGLWNAFEREKVDVGIGEFASVAISPNSDLLATTERFIPIEPNRIRPARQGFVGLNNTKVAFSPDGSLVAMAVDENIELIDVETQTVIATIKGHDSDVRSLTFSPDGTKIVSGGYDATIRQWAVVGDVQTTERPAITMDGLILDIMPTAPPAPAITETTLTTDTIESADLSTIRQAISNVVDIDVAPDGSSAVIASLRGVFYVDLTDLTTPPIPMTPSDENIFPAGLAVDYAQDGTRVVVSHGYARSQEAVGGGVTVWNIINGRPELIDEYAISGDRAFSIALSNNNTLIAMGFDSPKAQILDLRVGDLIAETQEPLFGRIVGLSFSADDTTLTLADSAGNKAFFRTATGEVVGGFNSGISYPMWWSQDNQFLYSAEQSGFILRNGSNSEPIQDNAYPQEIFGDIYTTDIINGRLVIGGENIIWFLDYHTGDISQTINFDGTLLTAEVTLDGQQLIAVSNDNRLWIWDIESGDTLNTIELGFTEPSAGIAISDDGQFVAIANRDMSIRIFSADSGAFLREIETQYTRPIRFLPNSTILTATRYDDLIELWDVDSGRLLDTLYTDDHLIINMSDNGDYLISRSDLKLLTLQNVRTGAVLFDDVQVHLGWFNDAQISITENVMATAGDDGVVKLWDLETREQITLLRDSGAVRYVAFAPDYPLLAIMGADGIRVYDYRFRSTIREEYLFTLSTSSPNGLFFSVDGSLLFAHIADSLHVWSMDDGRKVATYTVTDGVAKLSADGQQVLIANYDGTIMRVRVPTTD